MKKVTSEQLIKVLTSERGLKVLNAIKSKPGITLDELWMLFDYAAIDPYLRIFTRRLLITNKNNRFNLTEFGKLVLSEVEETNKKMNPAMKRKKSKSKKMKRNPDKKKIAAYGAYRIKGASPYFKGRYKMYGPYQWNIKFYDWQSDDEIEAANEIGRAHV